MTLKCDSCVKAAEFIGDFKYCISEAKGQSWIVIKKRDKWHHYCSKECRGKIMKTTKELDEELREAPKNAHKLRSKPLTFMKTMFHGEESELPDLTMERSHVPPYLKNVINSIQDDRIKRVIIKKVGL